MIKNKKLRYVLFIILTVFVVRFAYKYSPKRIEFLGHYEKVGAHRVNSLEKLTAALNHFEIIELDLVYFSESQSLDVGHPPVPSIGLTFEKYLNTIPKDDQPFLWLDIKNLTSENASEVLNRISLLLKKRKYPFEKLLIESQVLQKLLIHLQKRTDVQNIDLMNLSGFCRNCLSRWYSEAASENGIGLDKDKAREIVYGMPHSVWKEKYQTEETKELKS